ncbi:hypothetical protein QUB64_02090 [Microcoleus sp. Aus8_D2]|uniref:hypothetical protein n=1 Tax=Microcoleus sp. Aus8_D2 TaxID=2818632 RepID=UPI002FD7451B
MWLIGNSQFPIPIVRDTEVTEAGIAVFLSSDFIGLFLSGLFWLILAYSGLFFPLPSSLFLLPSSFFLLPSSFFPLSSSFFLLPWSHVTGYIVFRSAFICLQSGAVK